MVSKGKRECAAVEFIDLIAYIDAHRDDLRTIKPKIL